MAKKNFTVTGQDLTASMATPTPLVVNNTAPDPEAIGRAVERVMTGVKKLDRQTTGKNKGLKPNEERVSFVLLDGQYEKLQLIAYWERKTLKDTVIDILNAAFIDYERENGKIQPKPVKK
jgi:hypothetical protein